MKGTIRCVGISEGRHPLGRPGDRHYHPLGNHVIKDVLYLLSVFYGYLPLGMLDQGYVRVSPDGIGTRNVADCVKQAGEAVVEGNCVPGHHIRGYGEFGWVRVTELQC